LNSQDYLLNWYNFLYSCIPEMGGVS